MDRVQQNQRPIDHLLSKTAALSPAVAGWTRLFLRVHTTLGITHANVFEVPQAKDFDRILQHLRSPVEIPESLTIKGIDSHHNPVKVIAIRAFRSGLESVWSSVDKLRIFLSSGTTSVTEGRSRSGFSPAGLEIYQSASISAYFSMLEMRVKPFSDEFMDTVTVSLIPTVEEWPDSSLAQMVAWLGDIWPIKYTDSADVKTTQRDLELLAASNKPIVLFGTAFHFVNLFEDGLTVQLPPGSVVIETGGTKGRSREVTRDELYDLIRARCGVSTDQIVSEYGMCELASPAWDLIAAGESSPLDRRFFRFPWWVKTFVDENSEEFLREGSGCLSIQDPLRVDLGGIAIQTEDLAAIDPHQGFRLLGRVPKAPLKGCSLRVADVLGPGAIKTKSSPRGDSVIKSSAIDSVRTKTVEGWLGDLCGDPRSISALTRELGIGELATLAMDDLKNSVPQNSRDLETAALNAVSGDSVSSRWCFVPPSSHSVAAIHPLIAATTLGLKIRVRLPKIAALRSDETFLAVACETAARHGLSVTTLPEPWRLGRDDLMDGEHVLVFGDDDTTAFFESFAPGRVSAFGNAVSGTLTSLAELRNRETCLKIFRDQFTLAQRGCLSSRFMICSGAEPREALLAMKEHLPAYLVERNLSTGERVAVGLEASRLRQMGCEVEVTEGKIILCAVTGTTSSEILDLLPRVISRLDFVIPVIVSGDEISADILACQLKSRIPLRALSVSNLTVHDLVDSKLPRNWPADIQAVRHGSLGAPIFDGTHLGRRFFDSSVPY